MVQLAVSEVECVCLDKQRDKQPLGHAKDVRFLGLRGGEDTLNSPVHKFSPLLCPGGQAKKNKE